jgi:hypothetical protein
MITTHAMISDGNQVRLVLALKIFGTGGKWNNSCKEHLRVIKLVWNRWKIMITAGTCEKWNKHSKEHIE